MSEVNNYLIGLLVKDHAIKTAQSKQQPKGGRVAKKRHTKLIVEIKEGTENQSDDSETTS